MRLLCALSRSLLTRFSALCLCGGLAAPNPAWPQADPDDYESFYTAIYGAASVEGFGYNGPDRPLSERIKLPGVASDIEKKAVAAYFWGVPLVEMRRSQQLILNLYDLNVNELYTPHGLNTGESVVAPNLDVLYVQGFIDFSDPSHAGRFEPFAPSKSGAYSFYPRGFVVCVVWMSGHVRDRRPRVAHARWKFLPEVPSGLRFAERGLPVRRSPTRPSDTSSKVSGSGTGAAERPKPDM